jgi:hypothetical protein
VSEPNSTPDLQQALQRLHAQLSAVPPGDESSKHLLRELLHDIERALGNQDPVAHAPRARLADLAVRFDVDHPALAGGIREFIALLGSAGL